MEKTFEILLKKYKVIDLIPKDMKLLFILESPHIDELINKSPVSGSSGKAMTKVLFGEENKTPLGILIKETIESGKIGILNICQIPMQKIAYLDEEVIKMYGNFNEKEFGNFLTILEKLRVGLKETYNDKEKENVQQMILNDLKNRLSNLKNKDITVVPCGKMAQEFFKLANLTSEKWKIVENVPHPSYGNWYKDKYKEEIENIKDILK